MHVAICLHALALAIPTHGDLEDVSGMWPCWVSGRSSASCSHLDVRLRVVLVFCSTVVVCSALNEDAMALHSSHFLLRIRISNFGELRSACRHLSPHLGACYPGALRSGRFFGHVALLGFGAFSELFTS